MFDYTVNVEEDKANCSCNMLTLDYFPCSHVFVACSRGSGGVNRAFVDLVPPWYTSADYKAAYSPLFHPVLDNLYWEAQQGPCIKPPPIWRNAGRPQSTRIKGAMDQRTSVGQNRCNKCGGVGHKIRSCTK